MSSFFQIHFRGRRRFFAALALMAFVLCGPRDSIGQQRRAADKPTADDSLESQVSQIIDDPLYQHAHWGLLVVDLESGETLYELNPDRLFAPASTTKLFSVAAAWDILGPDHRFETPVHVRGELDQLGILDGDLILVATGDLTMGGRTQDDGRIAFTNADHTYANGNNTAELTKPDPLAGLNELARQIVGAGIRRVKGDVIVDDRLFDQAISTGSGPTHITPIIINDNLIDLQLTPTRVGAPAKLYWRPQTSAYQVESKVQTVAAGEPVITSIKEEGPGHIVITGQIPLGQNPLVKVFEVSDPASFARTLFIEELDRAGVVVEASVFGTNPDPKDLPSPEVIESFPRVARLVSPPFSESARLILKVSHNLHASTLPLLLAANDGKKNLRDGLNRQREFLLRAGVDVDSISFGGGAGGDQADFVTPRAVIQLLRYLSSRPDFDAIEETLPILGSDGTLATFGAESPAKGKVLAKTGTLLWDNSMNGGFIMTSKALAGYIETKQKRKLVFGFYVNNVHLKESTDTTIASKALNRLCEIFYEYKQPLPTAGK
ncbi:MAG: D-alanyl-D-alanine carboxypeptidase/D-alanyl-D-alanine-endopeptidase [Planctomycetaceae bacterium]